MRIARGISIANASRPISTAIVYDADAAAFFTAASITDNTQKSAVNTLVLDLKSANIWTKMKALYPVVGGFASSHAVNLKTPGTFNLTFATGWTHASTGMTPLNTYANTSIVPSIDLSGKQNNTHLSFYSRTDTTIGGHEIGAQYLSGDSGLIQMAIRQSNNFTCRINDDATQIAISNTNSTGMYMISRRTSTTIDVFRNLTKNSINQTSSGLPIRVIEIGRILINGNPYLSTKQCAFASIGDGLTDAEASSFYTAVQNYQTTLGRQV